MVFFLSLDFAKASCMISRAFRLWQVNGLVQLNCSYQYFLFFLTHCKITQLSAAALVWNRFPLQKGLSVFQGVLGFLLFSVLEINRIFECLMYFALKPTAYRLRHNSVMWSLFDRKDLLKSESCWKRILSRSFCNRICKVNWMNSSTIILDGSALVFFSV